MMWTERPMMMVSVFARRSGVGVGDLELRNYMCDTAQAVGTTIVLTNVTMFGNVPSDPTKRQNVIIPAPTGAEYIVTTEEIR